jgi:hypothetical protein
MVEVFNSLFKKIIFAKIIITLYRLTNKYIRLFSKSFNKNITLQLKHSK